MTDTIFFQLIEDDWTEISTGGSQGFITAGKRVITYVESDTTPLSSDKSGHVLNASDYVRYQVGGAFKVFARSTSGNTKISVTPD